MVIFNKNELYKYLYYNDLLFIKYIYCFIVLFIHLADAFIQSNLQMRTL